MAIIYVLIIVTSVNGGATVSTQEFTSEEKCETARSFVMNSQKTPFGYRILGTACVKK